MNQAVDLQGLSLTKCDSIEAMLCWSSSFFKPLFLPLASGNMLEKKNAPDIVTCIKLKTLLYAVDRAYILKPIQYLDFRFEYGSKNIFKCLHILNPSC